MTLRYALLASATMMVSAGAHAADAGWSADHDVAEHGSGAGPAAPAPASKTFSTGVAKGRDLLDSAISATSLDEDEVQRLGVTSTAAIIGSLPGIRVETTGTDGYSSMTVRGLPISGDGSKYLQIQEDGLPVLELGDIHFAGVDTFVRADLSLSQVQAIRGGSASTFASNSPGGVINLISKTGEVEGGSVRLSAGLGYDLKRMDFSYGAPLGHGWRFHVGGFYRVGEGPRHIGYNAYSGGQVKLNVTKEFEGGYIRFYGKYLDDREPDYSEYPIAITGSNDKPVLSSVAGTNVMRDTVHTKYTTSGMGMDENNNPTIIDAREGIRAISRSAGLETQFELGDWTISDRFRYASNGGAFNQAMPGIVAPAAVIGGIVAHGPASFAYATGPQAGQVIADPATLNGNGLLAMQIEIHAKLRKLDHVANDMRATRVWTLGEGKLTTTAGLYAARQSVDTMYIFGNSILAIAGRSNAALVDVFAADGTALTQGGYASFGMGVIAPPSTVHRRYDLQYNVLAPYASANYQLGRLAIGGSVRVDRGRVNGTLYGAELGGGRNGVAQVDVNHDGVISVPERAVAILPLSQPGIIDYTYRYVSYSAGVNYRLAPEASVFARYSRGGRATGERAMFTSMIDLATGGLADPSSSHAPIKQAEAGLKLRKQDVSIYVTGFWASAYENDFQVGADTNGNTVTWNVHRDYSAKGVELEAEAHRGPYHLKLGATYVKARIDSDRDDASNVGHKPRHQPSLLFQARPEYATTLFNVGAQVSGQTSSFAQDSNLLKQPGYVIVSPYLFVRPVARLELGLNAFNVFDKLAIVQLGAGAVPASGIATAQVINGRTVTGSLRFNF
ncbi:TonB-dependent receptor [Novosphingobium sp. SG720]|uniref:TonB-dependent receptor n=1 Tax=Novosphingobium sp. SG720 TaxID=2586998 RepID=UPI0017DB6E95|nr:TonB-dependent receptor [Novosphingobium sp. SG720]NKJ44438.1 outer membrane receptor protein involved in Fe transport [Novosphingobium sp. SG720]